MQNLILAINVVLPIALIMLLGAYLKKIEMLNTNSINVMNKLVFRVFMGTLMFVNVYNVRKMDIDISKNLGYFGYPMLFVLLVFGIAWLLFHKFVKDRQEFAVMVQGVYRGNFALFGLPIAESIYGQEGMSRVAMLLAVVIPIYNIIAVITLEYYSGKEINWKKMLKATATNPLITGCILAVLCIKLGIELPKPIYKTLFDLSKIATPLSFIILGASLEFGNMRKNLKALFSVNFMKLIINPIITLGLGYYLGFVGVEMVALLAMSACPTAVSSFTMAKDMNVAGDLAGEIVASTTIISIFTIFVWVILLKTIAWI